jgi:hypothetical protein
MLHVSLLFVHVHKLYFTCTEMCHLNLIQGGNQLTASLTGPGVVFIQSLPFHRLSQRIARYDEAKYLLNSHTSLGIYDELYSCILKQ